MFFSTALIFLLIVLNTVFYYLRKQNDQESNDEYKSPSLSASSLDQQTLHKEDHGEGKDPTSSSSKDKQCRRFSLEEIKLATHDEYKSPSLFASSLDQQTLHKEDLGEGKDPTSSSSKDKQCRRFSLEEIKLATHDFDDTFVIGKGGFGKVYKGKIDLGEEIEVAIKRSNIDSNQGATEFWAEIEMLSKFRHSHIVSLLGYCEDSGTREMILVYEYMPNGSLYDQLHKKRATRNNSSALTWVQRLHICIGAARGLDYLHTGTGVQCRVIHRDVKSSNILLDENLVAKISDFGVSRTGPAYQSGATTNVYTDQIIGTFGYMDAEYFSTHRLTRKSDVYAFGVVLFEVLCGRRAVDFRLDEQQHSLAGWAKQCIKEGNIDRIIDPCLKGKVKGNCLKEFGKIANECVLTCSKDRPTMTKVLARLEFVLAKTFRSGQSDQKHITRKILVEKALSLFNTKASKNMYPLDKSNNNVQMEDVDGVPSFSLYEIAKATNNFSPGNKIGEVGFDSVYKGVLEDGKVIAVKRFSKTSQQWFDEFKNEVICTAKLQHQNLVKFLGYCIHENEMILIHEYMANESLDRFLFDETRSLMLDWPKRLHIIHGIARGVLYLHHGSDRCIILRDLNARNILLDDFMVSKISGFRLARVLVGSETSADTYRILATFSYMAPEYVMHGLLSIKSDVFSFGVVVLEIVSGKRFGGYFLEDQSDNLLENGQFFLLRPGHQKPQDQIFSLIQAWRLYEEVRSIELMSASLRDSCIISEVLHLIHVGLLCVQFYAEDRPTMLEVVDMLHGEGVLPQPKRPDYSFHEDRLSHLNSVSSGGASDGSDEEYMITQVYSR